MSETSEKVELRVDPDFRSLCPPLTPEELSQLEENLVAEHGAREPLVTWQGTLLDGHNRHEICKRLDLPFTTTEAKGVSSREQAFAWIVANQLGRRNLTPEQVSYLRGRRYNFERGAHGGERASGQSDHLKTAEKLAEELKVGERTIRRDGEFAAAVDTLAANVGPEVREKVLARGARVTRAEVVKLAALPKEQQLEEARAAVSPEKRTIRRRPRPKPPKGFIEKARPSTEAVVEARVFKTFDEVPAGKYACLYLDVPWDLVPSHELAGLDLARLVCPAGAQLWIWTTWPLLRRGVVVNLLKKWGFAWEGEVVWLKDGPATEVLLVARSRRADGESRGEGATALLTGAPDETGRPAGARELVAASTSGPKIELFARRVVAGWDAFTPELVVGRDPACERSRSPSSSPQPSQVA